MTPFSFVSRNLLSSFLISFLAQCLFKGKLLNSCVFHGFYSFPCY
jgi:hypothetical protein